MPIQPTRATFNVTACGNLTGSFDEVRLHQLLTNLLVNAAQYGTKARVVLLQATGQREEIVIQVTNFGTAIAPEALQSIFKPLVQLSSQDGQDAPPKTSLGLGLFVAREIALAHGGSIDVQSDPVEGTTFTVRLSRHCMG